MSPQEEILVRIYQRAEAELRLRIRLALERGAIGTATYWRGQHEAIRRLALTLGRRTRPAAGAAITNAYLEGVRQAQLVPGVRFSFAGATGPRHRAAVEGIAQRLAGSLEGTIATMHQSATAVLERARAILEEQAVGIATGAGRRTVSSALRHDLINQGITGLVDAGGKRWSLGTYARMATRTETRNAASAGVVNRMRDFGQDLVTISDHGATDEICAEYAGNTYSLDGKTPGYDVLDQLPPFHPNCMHVVTPASEAFDAAEAALLEG